MRVAVAALALATASAAAAAPQPGPAYGDRMVLQRGEPVMVAGTAAPGARVTGMLGETSATATADGEGAFTLVFPARPASADPLTLTLADESGETAFHDILVGDVYLCAGQSNMELGVNRALDTWNQLQQATDDGVRLITVPKATAPVPQPQFASPVEWVSAVPATVEPFSAACWYMAKDLRAADPATPIGLVNDNWGGSKARAWLAPSGVEALYGREATDLLDLYGRDPLAATQAFAPQWLDWYRGQTGGAQPWLDTATLDLQPIPEFSMWNEWEGTPLAENTVATVWLRQTVTLTAEQAAAGASLAVGAIDDMDFTFVNGRPVGYTFGWGVERAYDVPADHWVEGENEILIAATNGWSTGGFFAGPDRLFVTPAGGEPIPLGADWDYAIAPVSGDPPRAPWDANAGTGVMHNAMIAPLGPMRMKGVLWYQGESDVGSPGYQDRLRQLFAGWRGQFGSQARMMVVQLANFGQMQDEPQASGWAEIREDQRQAVVADDNAALVTAIDIGEWSDIHPANKNTLGRRLSLAAREMQLPQPVSARLEGDTITVQFSGVEGALEAIGGPYPLGVELCGDAQESCRWVLAALWRDRMLIRADAAQPATRVRYGWADAPILNTYDGRDLPLPGFELEIQR